jgi:hypothetical protein
MLNRTRPDRVVSCLCHLAAIRILTLAKLSFTSMLIQSQVSGDKYKFHAERISNEKGGMQKYAWMKALAVSKYP